MEIAAAFIGSLIGVAVGIVGSVHLWHRTEQRAALKRAEAKRRHPAGKRVVESEVQSSPYNGRRSA